MKTSNKKRVLRLMICSMGAIAMYIYFTGDIFSTEMTVQLLVCLAMACGLIYWDFSLEFQSEKGIKNE